MSHVPNAKWQPYLGLGINYTVFFEEKFNPAMTDTTSPVIDHLGNGAQGSTDAPIDLADLKLKNSWGLSAQVGVDYHLDDNWLVNASARYIDIDTTATFTAVDGAVPGTVDVEIDPWVYTLSIGYKF
jgi:outer membrane protein